MKTEMTIQVRAFPVLIQDQRTSAETADTIILTREQLQAVQIVGQSSKELIQRCYNRKGFKVLEIGTAVKRSMTMNLEELYFGAVANDQ